MRKEARQSLVSNYEYVGHDDCHPPYIRNLHQVTPVKMADH